MSFSRANVTWQAPDGSWCIGFYTVVEPDFTAPDFDWDSYDEEHDVDYDDTFEFASVGHSSPDTAWEAGTIGRGNPGSTRVYRLDSESAACELFDTLAAAYFATTAASDRRKTL